MEQVTFLYNVTVLEDPSFPTPLNTQQFCPTPEPHSRASSRRTSIASINPILNALPVDNKHRPLSVIVSACPIIDGVKSRCVESRWSCMLDVPTLSMDESMPSSRLEVGNKHAPMTCDDKFNYNKQAVHDLFSSYNEISDYKSLQNIGSGNNLSGVGLEINVNGVDNNKKYNSGYPDINLLGENNENNGILPSGRLPKVQKPAVCDDVAVSFAGVLS